MIIINAISIIIFIIYHIHLDIHLSTSSVLFTTKVACSAGSACHAVHTPQSDVTEGTHSSDG